MYKILGADQKEYGPVGADQVRQWIAARRVIAQTQVQMEGSSQWKPLSEFPEFQDALQASTPSVPPPQVSPPGMPSVPTNAAPTSGLAIASLVLGILSLIACSILSGIPAIITGHIAHNRTRRQPGLYGGGGIAIAGFVLGYLSLLCIPVWAAMMLPALSQAKSRAQTINCVNNMKQIGLAARMWAESHDGYFPLDFLSMSNELVSPKILACPGDPGVTKALDWDGAGPENISYEFLAPGANTRNTPELEAFRCPIHDNIGYADGSVTQHARDP